MPWSSQCLFYPFILRSFSASKDLCEALGPRTTLPPKWLKPRFGYIFGQLFLWKYRDPSASSVGFQPQNRFSQIGAKLAPSFTPWNLGTASMDKKLAKINPCLGGWGWGTLLFWWFRNPKGQPTGPFGCLLKLYKYLEPKWRLYFWRSTHQNKAPILIKTRGPIWVPGNGINYLS